MALRQGQERQQATQGALDPPETIEEAESHLASLREEIREQKELIERVRGESSRETKDTIREDLRKRIDRLTADLHESEAQLKLLEASLEKLKPKLQPQPCASRED